MFIKIRNLNINYICEGEGEPVVILHGWGCNIGIYSDIIKHLSERCKVYCLDLPGFGKSDEPQTSWNISEYSQFIADFLKVLKIENPILLGHSFGGRIIIKLLSENFSIYARKVILTGGAGIMHKKSLKKKLRIFIVKTAKKLFELKLIKRFFGGISEKLRKKYGSPDYAKASPIMRGVLVKAINEDLTPYLQYINCPTLLIWGENDTETPISDAQIMAKHIKGSGLAVINNAGHFAFLEQKARFLKIIDAFI